MTEESFGSDHLLLTSSILLPTPPTPLPPPNHVRLQWKLQRLTDPDIYKFYIDAFTDKSWTIIRIINSITTLESYQQIEDIGNLINDTIYSSLDHSVTKSTLRPKHWKWFWTQELEDLTNEKKQKHIQWRKSLKHNDSLRTAALCVAFAHTST